MSPRAARSEQMTGRQSGSGHLRPEVRAAVIAAPNVNWMRASDLLNFREKLARARRANFELILALAAVAGAKSELSRKG